MTFYCFVLSLGSQEKCAILTTEGEHCYITTFGGEGVWHISEHLLKIADE